MKKQEESENSFFGGFEAVVDGLARVERVKPGASMVDPEEAGFETVTDIGERLTGDIPLTDPEEITGKPTKILEDEDGLQGEEEIEEEEIEEVPVVTGQPTTNIEESDLGEYEQDVVDFFTDRFSTELGWELEEEKKPKTVTDVIEYIKDVITVNSKPEYANEEIEKLNEFVANGGDLRKFYSDVYNTPDFDAASLEDENVQKKILTDNFERLGYTREKINKFISRYEDSGTLQEEAEDAFEGLKEYKREKAEKLLAEQENVRKETVKQQQKFYTDVYNNIEKTDSIRGIPISAKEKKELSDYIFKPEADGFTKYQKDYAKDNRNLIESAYFTMKGDSLIQKVTQKATSQAAKNLQDKLANKGKRVKNAGTTHGSQGSTLAAWDTVSKQLRRPNF